MMNQAVTERLIKELPQGMKRMEIRLPGKTCIIDAAKPEKKSAQEQLKEIKILCRVLIRQEKKIPSSQKEWLRGRADAARMILETLN